MLSGWVWVLGVGGCAVVAVQLRRRLQPPDGPVASSRQLGHPSFPAAGLCTPPNPRSQPPTHSRAHTHIHPLPTHPPTHLVQVRELLTAEQWEAIRDVASPASYFV